MKNTGLFPLTRNRYFRGKQLVARDMEAEQRYFNNKRRLLNSQLFGCGVVCGLLVTAVGSDTAGGDMAVAVEPGLAIDGMGREVVVPELLYLHLAKLDGFSERGRSDLPLYLCVEYAETECEPVHSIADSAVADDQHNRVEEGYRFYLQAEEPPAPASWKAGGDSERIRWEYYAENLDKRLERGKQEVLVLARIHLVRWDTAYSIKQVEPMPFGQYVMTAELLASLQSAWEQQHAMDDGARQEAGATAQSTARVDCPAVRQGTVFIEVPRGTKSGTLLRSEQIPHGLGIGPVSLTIGLMASDTIVYGGQGVFEEEADCEVAARVSVNSGTFEVGVRVYGPVADNRLVFAWTAMRDPVQGQEPAQEPQLLVTPSFQRIALRGVVHFSAKVLGLHAQAVRWSVRETEGGTIDEQGAYRAPNTAGVYEVVACSVEKPELQASAFVVVTGA